jgi:uncharacterized C2H2 Zn-finger protein
MAKESPGGESYFDRFCPYCQKVFKSEANLGRHVSRLHPDTYLAIHLEKKGVIPTS